MNKTLDYVQTISKQREIPLVWWGVSEGSFYYPYSKFHWASSEDPQNSDFYILIKCSVHPQNPVDRS